jgi:hypothetical protein
MIHHPLTHICKLFFFLQSKGMNVAFVSPAFTRNLYKGLVEITPIKVTGLPDEDSSAEALLTGGGVDACLLVAAVEGQWKEDIELLEKQYSDGIMDLSGATHVGRSSVAWANVNENQSNAAKKKTGKALAYHIPKGWGRDGAAVWPDEDPFYLYLQDPANARLIFTIFDQDAVGEGSAVGSTFKPLSELLPQVKNSQKDVIDKIKASIIEKIKKGDVDPSKVDEEIDKALKVNSKAWEGDLKLTSKARIKDKKGQRAMAMAAGAMVAGPVGAALGAVAGSFYEGEIKGRITARLRYLPIPQVDVERKIYDVKGGLPGVDWGNLYEKYLSQKTGIASPQELANVHVAGKGLEHCFFIDHDTTGGCCAVYRSLEKKLIVVSFRGTCTPVDLVTDASIIQEPWVSGEDEKDPETAKVHVGFRKSLNSISRRLKELLLATVEPGDNISDYDMIVTGHSLGGALSTLFAADIGEFGIDAGRALPQTDVSEDWWKSIQSTVMGKQGVQNAKRAPPRPKSLRVYNFGSPRVGSKLFAKRFDGLLKAGKIDQAYRIVNDQDLVARLPRTMYTLSIDYDHCGSTALVIEEPTKESGAGPVLWIEGESDDKECPVRDYETRMSSPIGEGTLLGDLFKETQDALQGGKKEGGKKEEKKQDLFSNMGNLASKVGERLSTATASDFTSLIGMDRSFTDREMKIVNSLFQGKALAHHMEDKYYAAMGRAGGFIAEVGEDLAPIRADTTKP